MTTSITVNVNGQDYTREIEDNLLLVYFLRETLGMTGSHVGCDTTQCGCCTVQLNGNSAKSCTVLAAQADGCTVRTVEGLEKDGVLHPVQKAFRDCHGLQCGFCTPGMIMTAVDLIEHATEPLTEHVVRHEMEGNLCRCTGYHNIVKAVLQADKEMHPAQQAAE
jgi:carbon-monoxide dehydrogenase small subunit